MISAKEVEICVAGHGEETTIKEYRNPWTNKENVSSGSFETMTGNGSLNMGETNRVRNHGEEATINKKKTKRSRTSENENDIRDNVADN